MKRWATLCLGLSLAQAQEADRIAPNTRAGQIEADRRDKAERLTPDAPGKVEQGLQYVKRHRIVERFTAGTAGIRAHLGGLITGSGFAAGPEYYRRLSHEDLIIRTSVRASLRDFYLIDAEASLPHLARDRVFAGFLAVHRDYPHVDYYGPGPDSRKSGRTGFTLEDTSFQARTGVRPLRHLDLGVMGRYLLVNVGPGRDSRFASTDQVFSSITTPGLHRQSNYLQAGPFVQYDYRDNPGGPRTGGYYLAEYSTYSDRKLGLGSFSRVDLEAQQYFPFFNQRRVIAVRGRGEFTEPHAGQFVPFYLQPTLGGPDTLRGFRPFRFYDNNAVVMNAEYRWEVFSGMDMAVFYDTGKVFQRWQDASLADLENSYGFGLRFNVRNSVFMRIDTGFSREGFQVWLKFGNVF